MFKQITVICLSFLQIIGTGCSVSNPVDSGVQSNEDGVLPRYQAHCTMEKDDVYPTCFLTEKNKANRGYAVASVKKKLDKLMGNADHQIEIKVVSPSEMKNMLEQTDSKITIYGEKSGWQSLSDSLDNPAKTTGLALGNDVESYCRSEKNLMSLLTYAGAGPLFVALLAPIIGSFIGTLTAPLTGPGGPIAGLFVGGAISVAIFGGIMVAGSIAVPAGSAAKQSCLNRLGGIFLSRSTGKRLIVKNKALNKCLRFDADWAPKSDRINARLYECNKGDKNQHFVLRDMGHQHFELRSAVDGAEGYMLSREEPKNNENGPVFFRKVEGNPWHKGLWGQYRWNIISQNGAFLFKIDHSDHHDTMKLKGNQDGSITFQHDHGAVVGDMEWEYAMVAE